MPTESPAAFSGAHVVQLVRGAATDADAVVLPVHEATVTVAPDALVAQDAAMSWAWPIDDVIEAVHGRAGTWTILVVPEVDDFGVAVAREDEQRFRDELNRLIGDRVLHQTAAGEASDRAEILTVDIAPVGPLGDFGDGGPASDVEGCSDVDVRREEEPSLAAPVKTDSAVVSEPAAIRSQPSATASDTGLAQLEARSISAWFGSHLVLDRVSLTMEAGEVTALIGPSGCGKSTFLRILNRMHEMVPSAEMAGEVLLDGQDIYEPSRKLTEARRNIGMVFQKPNPFPAMSIYDNVVASLRVTGTKASIGVKDELVESCLTKAGLWTEVRDRLRQPGGGLSGGQQQRLCIARALAIKPRVLLMDEPCSALDPTSTRRIEQTIMELASEVTIVIVTHNMQQAARVSDQCAFFLAEQNTPGVIVEHGPTDAMFGSPRDPRTDDYVNGRFG